MSGQCANIMNLGRGLEAISLIINIIYFDRYSACWWFRMSGQSGNDDNRVKHLQPSL